MFISQVSLSISFKTNLMKVKSMFRDIISDIACKMVSSRETNCKKHAISVDFNFSFVFYYLCPPFPPSYIRYNLKKIFTFNSISIMNLTYQCKRAAMLTINFIFRVTKNNAKIFVYLQL